MANWTTNDTDEAAAQKLADELDILPITARILLNRGIRTEAQARQFLNPGLADIPDPFLLPDMKMAVERLADALAKGKRIAIFGDYDVDGISGTALLALFLKELGIDPITMLPNRTGEGYGLTLRAVEALKDEGADMIVTVDNGTHAAREIERARQLGMDVIITDHHNVTGAAELKRDDVPLVNPQMLEEGSPLRQLSGCGVAFMLALALRRRLRDIGRSSDPEPNLRQHLDLVALGTIADIVPLTGANRTLARFGLAEIARTSKPGIKALVSVSGTVDDSISTGVVAFRLAPRLNAAGRIGDANTALQLLLCDDASEAYRIAGILDRANRERQEIEERILSEADEKLRGDALLDERRAIVVHSENWHLGVIGIVASKIAERHNKPAVVISRDTEPARGSARSACGIDLILALERASEHLARYGGHALAAGLTIAVENIGAFAKAFDRACRELAPARRGRDLKIDAVVEPADITDQLIHEIARCSPFGMGNPEPVLAMHDMDVRDARIVGEKHLKLKLACDGVYFDAIGFGMGDAFQSDCGYASLAFTPQFNEWNGATTIQLKVKDMKSQGA